MNDAFERRVAEASAHVRAGRLAEAQFAFEAALHIRPQHAGVLHNLGALAAKRGDERQALRYFDASLAADPHAVSVHYHRALALAALGNRREAIAGLSRALALEPGHYEAHRTLALCLLAEGRRGPALDHFARTYELRRGEDRGEGAANSFTTSNLTKLTHDAAQFRTLAARKRDGLRFEMLAKAYDSVARAHTPGVFDLSADERDVLGEGYNTAIHLADAPEVAESAVSPRPDREQILDQYHRDGAVHFDDLLSPGAFESFRRYLLESTIWHDFSYIEGFVAAYLEDGLACPLLLQIADEIRRAFPELLGDHALSQAWAFRAVGPSAAVDVHVDDGAVSLNFWMTPTDANLKPAGGGMRVCLAPPPADWTMASYDSDKDRAARFLEQNAAQTLTIPYRANRAVLFRSRLVHASDAPNFAHGYDNHRINVTLLFGRAPTAPRPSQI